VSLTRLHARFFVVTCMLFSIVLAFCALAAALPCPAAEDASGPPAGTAGTETTAETLTPAGDPVLVDAVYVVVDKRVITFGEIVRKVEPTVARIIESNPGLSGRELDELRAQVFREVVQHMITKALILKAAREEGLDVDEARVGSQIRRILVSEGATLEEYLRKQGMTYQELFQEVHDDYLYSAYRQVQIAPRVYVSPSEVRAYYEAHKDDDEFVTPEKVDCWEIVLFGNDAERRQKADEALAKLKAGAKFEDVAREFSENAGIAKDGGHRGWIARNVINSQTVNDALFDELDVGQVSDVIEDQNGYLWIVKIDGRREESRTPIGEAYGTIEQRLERAKLEYETRKYASRLARTTAILPEDVRDAVLGSPDESRN
jgi:peptidyl-prolyl cis-trans isomerase SurA